MARAQWKMEASIGTIYLVASETGLRSLYFSAVTGVPLVHSLKGAAPELTILRDAVSQLEQYFLGKRQDFDLPLELEGTEFQKKVWAQLKKIPYGKTYSYLELAKKVKNEKACRAVGGANGKNPIGIIIPCHRVIAADGTLGGYSGGLPNKVKLLELEKRISQKNY